MGKYSNAPFMHRQCLVCNKDIYGQKPVGSIEIFNTRGRKIGTQIYVGKMGYAHLLCKKKYMRSK